MFLQVQCAAVAGDGNIHPAEHELLVRIARDLGDLDLAEECVQDAYARALTAWAGGIPAKPGAWLTTVARRRALDLLRRDATLRRALPLLVEEEPQPRLRRDPLDIPRFLGRQNNQ